MNKQAFTFLTLFSLILVLSIYYIMLPPIANPESVSKTESVIEQLQNELNQKRETIINKSNEIIAKKTSTSDSISEALETISTTKDLSDQEKNIVSKIKELGYQEAYIEIDNQTVKATVLKKDSTKEDASKIIKTIMNIFDNKYHVEVKFISE